MRNISSFIVATFLAFNATICCESRQTESHRSSRRRRRGRRSDLLGDLAGALDQLLLGEGVVGAALQGSRFGHQPRAAEAQLAHLLLDVGANLGRRDQAETESVRERLVTLVPPLRGGGQRRPSPTHLVVLGRHGCIFGLVGQVSKLVGQLVGQSSEVVGVGVGLGHLGEEEETHSLTKVQGR